MKRFWNKVLGVMQKGAEARARRELRQLEWVNKERYLYIQKFSMDKVKVY